MIRSVFTVVACLSLVLCIISAVGAVWSLAGRGSRFVASNGRLWEVARTGDGGIGITTLKPWPREEPWVVTDATKITYQMAKGFVRREYGPVRILTGEARVMPGMFDPWGRTPPLAGSELRTVGLGLWQFAFWFAVLPGTWIARRLRAGENADVEK